ncbi:hypothetical protein I540_2822 [Mycobacteroides abscessus subsp. bolletii 1513]|uniref:Uncharacterized protein n=1 Tax=Mycobacteroides abscessus subsp. bolletii 1513 TaxID=1299321 RepID=X8DTD2_9MYCO|nr:hypothetical protein I540_2822 [Mycobacteroides abscessus subsp. bolletii 1513]
MQVATPDGGTADIDFNTMTKLTEVRPGELSDVVVGSCVSVLSAPGADTDDVTAQRVLISAAEDNKCAADTPPGGAPPPGIPQTPPLPGRRGRHRARRPHSAGRMCRAGSPPSTATPLW